MDDEIENDVSDQGTMSGDPPIDGELEKAKAQAGEYLNNWKKERADFINYKKDEVKRVEEFVRYANEDLILEIIEVLDDLELAVKELKNMGLEQIIKKFNELFKKYGVERIDVDGKFDPNLHEAIETHLANPEQAEQGERKMVEVRAGYTMHGKVIRPARVKIIK